jgi:hypothetical protein
MKLKLYRSFLAGLAGIILLGSCKRNSDKPMWDVDILTPLVQSSLTISNLIKDTTNIRTNSDNTITIVNRQSLSDVTLDSLVSLNTDPYSETFGLDQLVLPTRSDTTRISIQTIIDNLRASTEQDSRDLGDALFLAATFGVPLDLSGIDPLVFSGFDVDVSSFFNEANIATGTLTVKIKNTLPADVQSLNFIFKNKIGGQTIASHNFTNIVRGDSAEYSENLAGKTVEGILTGDMNPLQLVGEPNTVVSFDQAIEVIMTISGVTVNSATAVFPAQDLITKQQETSLTTLGDVELKKAIIESGAFNLYIESTLQQVMYINYKIPEAKKNGISFDTTVAVPAATGPGSPGIANVNLNMSGYTMDFTGIPGHDTVNTFYYEMTGRIEHTGQVAYLSSTDYMVATVTGQGLNPTQVEGYLGQKTFNIGPSVIDLPIFKGIESGILNFENIDMKMVVENGFGIDANVAIIDMTAENSRKGTSHTLTPLPTFNINRAPAMGLTSVNPGNFGTDATSLINILPDKVKYNVQVITNPGGNTGTYPDFAQKSALMKAYLDIEMPLSIMASELVLVDTAIFNTAAIKKKNVNSGTFKVFVNNGFPLSASLMMYFMDQYGVVTDSVKSLPDAIMAAPVNSSNRVIEKTSSEVSFEASEQMMDNLYRSSWVIFKIKFSTVQTTSSTFMKIYSDYSIDFKMVGDMDYSVHKK